MFHDLLRAAALSLVVAAASVYGQQGTTEVLYITLTNTASCEGIRVAVVMLGRDADRKPATYVGDCKWKFESPFGSFNTKITTFSLRLTGMRTRCRRARYDDARSGAAVDFRFSEHAAAKQLSIDVVPQIAVRYARQLDGSRPDIPCIEQGALPETLADVQFDLENLRLQLLPNQTPACGVVVNQIKRVTEARKGVPVTLTSEDAVTAVARQGNTADDCRTPTFSGAGLDVVERTLARQVPRSIVITVK